MIPSAQRLSVVGVVLGTVLGCSPAPVDPAATSTSASGVTPSATSSTSSAPPAPTEAQTAWADSLCVVDRALLVMSRSEAGAGWYDAPGPYRGLIVAFLTNTDTTLKSLQQRVDSLSPAPFAGGDAVVEAYRETIDPLQAKMAEYASQAVVFPPEGIAAVLRLSLSELVSFSVGAPSLDDPVYVRARELAPNCGGR